MNSFPKTIQIEPINACNFSCTMCLLSSWKEKKPTILSVSLFEKIARESFPHASRVVLYGIGEPLLHSNFLKLLELSRNYLRAEGTISFTTNGSLLSQNIVDTILEKKLVDEIVFSCDTFDETEENLGHSSHTSLVEANLDYILKHEKRNTVRVGIQTVVMQSNYKKLEKNVKSFINKKVDFVLISHLYPYKEEMGNEVMFTMLSSEALSIFEESNEQWDELILGVTREKFAEAIQEQYKKLYRFKDKLVKKERPYSDKYYMLQAKAREKNILLNASLYIKEKETGKLKKIKELQTVFEKIQRLAEESGVEIILPNIIPPFKERECPYHSAEALVIRSDGEVVPCFNYLYDHPTYLNYHSRESSSYSFGNVKNMTITEIWNSSNFSSFRNKLEKMNNSVPYCGNCSFSSNNCFYVTEGSIDCWGNEPFCSECPYSMNLTKCLL